MGRQAAGRGESRGKNFEKAKKSWKNRKRTCSAGKFVVKSILLYGYQNGMRDNRMMIGQMAELA
jgi:hypothetical protein